MRRLFPLCLLLGFTAATQANPVTKPVLPANPATRNGSVRSTVPPVSPPVNPLPEYLLTPPVPPGSGLAWRTAQEDTLREAMFRYLFRTLPPYSRQKFSVYFLSSRGFFPSGPAAEEDLETSEDPDAALLNRLRGSKPPVQPVSNLTRYKDWRTRYHRHWIIYRVSSFQWTGDASVKIEAGSLQSGIIGSDSVYLYCTLKNGWWTITGSTEASA